MYFIRFSEKTAIIFLNTIDQLVFLMKTGFEAETEFYVQFRSNFTLQIFKVIGPITTGAWPIAKKRHNYRRTDYVHDRECNHNLVPEGYSDDEIGREICVLLALQKNRPVLP